MINIHGQFGMNVANHPLSAFIVTSITDSRSLIWLTNGVQDSFSYNVRHLLYMLDAFWRSGEREYSLAIMMLK